jgi:hypothetical protein
MNHRKRRTLRDRRCRYLKVDQLEYLFDREVGEPKRSGLDFGRSEALRWQSQSIRASAGDPALP